MDETRRWSEGAAGFGSATSAEVLEKLTATHRRLLGTADPDWGNHDGQPPSPPAPEVISYRAVESDDHADAIAHQRESSVPGVPALNRRQRRALARGKTFGPSRRR